VRVALVAETFLPAVNGVVNSVVRAADQLALRGHQPVVIAPSGGTFQTPGGFHVDVVRVRDVPLPRHPGVSIARPGQDLRAVLAEVAPDVVHLASPLILGWAAAAAAADLGIPAVSVFQTDLAGFLARYRVGLSQPLMWSALRRLHAMTALTLAPSSATAMQLRARGIGPVAVWGRGVDGYRFSPAHRSEALRTELGAPDTLLVGFVGRLAAEKRIELLEPISRLPGVRLVVVGDGPKRAALQRRMPRASFVGMQGGEELSRWMASFDVLVNPGANETFCQVVQEALASGVPVIAAAAGGPLDLVRHRDNGWLWAGQDPQTLAAHVEQLSVDREELHAAARRSRASVVERTWDRIGRELIEHYRQVLADTPHGAVRAPSPVRRAG
jgi:phosphatidylinositol alpha 1,6-mannosyltransferase